MSQDTSVREALLDAAYDEIASGSWARARMADVARAAGVSRQTLYNEFGTKDALSDALSARQTGLFLAGAQAVLDEPGARPRDAVRDATRWLLDRAADDPVIKSVLAAVHDDDAAALLPYLTTRGEPLLTAAAAQLHAFLARSWPDADPARVVLVAESLTRLVVSHIVLPTQPAEATAAAVAEIADTLLTSGGQ